MAKPMRAATADGFSGDWLGARAIDSVTKFDGLSIDMDIEGKLEIPDNIPRIKACVTTWHEKKEEMIEVVKSIYAMDQDQCSRRIAALQFGLDLYEIGYYEFETHIFFDDAFHSGIPNEHVKTLLSVMDEPCFANPRLAGSPQKFATPYGGMLVWTLPGKTKMFVHLKDSSKIRYRKRWSQCMYMYYLLGYQFQDQNKHISPERLDVIAAHTFLLALDGDVSFTPRSVQLLVDAMKENESLGAACGRIHPIGSGPLVWYQKFEYASTHWLQKTAEDLLGCVLCSPGCFSLYRGRALLNEGVMNTYATTSSEPRHYLQHDQGEDRWLCTLLMKQGYRIGYSAATDVYTHTPDNLAEFYQQRRRWGPSVATNTMDLITNYSKALRLNSNMSPFYIAYQTFLLIATILGPGTIVVLLAGACITLFDMDPWLSFALNLVPVLVYAIVCSVCKNDTQVKVAKLLSIAYGVLMAGVLVGIALYAYQEGILSPPSFLPLMVNAILVLAAIFHPTEAGCLIHGLIYYLMLPTTHLLLTVFTVFNINIVSWGTRERSELQAETKEQPKMLGKEFDKKIPEEKIATLPEGEIEFWKQLIAKHLFPLDADTPQQQANADALLTLRNMSVFCFLVANGIFVLLIFLMTLHKEWLSVTWPLGDDLLLEPIGFVFVLFVIIILVVQLVALLVHRFCTLCHILIKF